ncbi:MAG: hypothetical protein QOE04_5140 [Mycobacterium sp.]|jgi:hypothetical protein|nr:hypothetical protein [Mycobacterium sp.]MDT5398425.1 hypothetical protein [Mycobacterium sp.]
MVLRSGSLSESGLTTVVVRTSSPHSDTRPLTTPVRLLNAKMPALPPKNVARSMEPAGITVALHSIWQFEERPSKVLVVTHP